MGCGFVVTCLRVFLGGLDVLGGLKLSDLAGGRSLGIFGGCSERSNSRCEAIDGVGE